MKAEISIVIGAIIGLLISILVMLFFINNGQNKIASDLTEVKVRILNAEITNR